MDKKNRFRKSLLSSAILAATLKTLSASAVASICPPPNTSGNVHVAPGSFCEGGVTVDTGTVVNDIGLEGKVVGDIINNDGMSDFWMDFGTLDGSFINNGTAQDVHIANGSEIYADIRNHGDMRYLSITDGPGANTVVHGSVVNTGGIVRVHVEGIGTEIGGDIVNADGASIMDGLLVADGATVSGNIYNNGSSREVIVNDGSSLAGHLVNDGGSFGVAVFDGSTVGGDFGNNGSAFYFVTHQNSAVDGSMINTGNTVHTGIYDGSTVTGDFGNEGYVDGVMIVEESTVGGDVFNGANGYTDGIHITDSSTIGGNVVNSGEAGFIVTARSQIEGDFINEGLVRHLGIYDSQIVGDVVNSSSADFLLAVGDGTTVGGDLVNTDSGYIEDGIALLDGASVTGSVINDGMLDGAIQLVNGSSVGVGLTNNGDVFVGPGSWQHISDGGAPVLGDLTVAGINIDAGSEASGNVANNGSLIINFPPSPPLSLPDGGAFLSDGVGLQHSLAGISVDHGSSVGDITNTGLIEVTAGLEHDGPEFAGGIQANGIQVKNGSTSGSITNNGDILADTFGIYVDGSGNDGVTVEGSVINAIGGTILSGDNGMYIKNAEVTGNVGNDGVIHSSNDNAIDIEDSIIGGSVVNTGSLISNEDYDAIDIDDSTIAGDIINTLDGDITGEDGIDVDDSIVTGSIVNAGVIIAVDEGFDIDQTYIGGDLANTGLIEAGRVGISIEGEEDTLPPVIVDGEMVTPPESMIHYATISGSFINSGEILSEDSGIVMEYVDIAGDFNSSGTIEAGDQSATRDEPSTYDHGIELDDVNISGNVTLGDISASGYGVNFDAVDIGEDFTSAGDITGIQKDALYMTDVDIAGNFTNHGELTAGFDGIDLSNVSIGGAFTNTGDINSFHQGISLSDVSIDDSFLSSGDIQSEVDSAISLTGLVSIAGNFGNSGELIANNHGIIMESDVGHVDGERVVDGLVSIDGDFVNSGDITAGGSGIWLSDVVVDGNLVNQGDITAEEGGIRLHYSTVGGVANFGDIAVVDGDVIDIDDTVINGNVENHGLLFVSEEHSGDGIDIDDSVVKGSVINFGEMNVNGTEGFDIDDSMIEGDVVNAMGAVINARSDVFYINDSHVKGNVINHGTIVAREHDGIDIEANNNRDVLGRIDGSLISTGNITAGDNGYELDGDWDASYIDETPDGVVTIPSVTTYLGIGGKLYNSGDLVAKDTGFDIELTSIGANGVLEDGQANFENHGNVTAGKGSTMDILGSSVAGDFINTGDLTIDESPVFEAGDNYRFSNEVITSPEGALTFESTGVDSEGNAWFVIKNEGESWTPVVLTAEDGSRVYDAGVGPGQEVFVTTGADNTGDYTLSVMDFGPGGPVPAVDGEIGVSAADLATSFQPAYNLNDGSEYQRGISFTGKTYYEDDGETGVGELIRSTVGGNFVNTGTITVKDEGIYLEHADIGGNFGNEGDITTEHATAIHVNDVTVGGDFVNTGNLSTGAGAVYQEGDSYRETWGGTPSEAGQVVIEAGGVDENGNQWFVIRNESDNYEAYKLKAVDGDFATTNFDLPPGEVIYVNTGQLSGDLELQHAWNDGAGVIATVGGSDSAFLLPETASHGISLTNTTVGGNFINTGDVDAVNHGISISNVGIAGAFESTGNITAGDHGILIEGERWFDEVDGAMVTDSLASIGGHFINTGNITSGNHGITLIDATVGGAFTNTGDIITGDGNGKYAINIVGNSEIGGDIVNTGNLTGGTGIRVYGTADLEDGQLVGGDIISVAGGLLNSGNINSSNDAIRVVGVDLGGALVNSGDIHNTGSDAIDIDDVIVNGNIENHGSVVTTSANAIDINSTLIDGHIINTGIIDSSGTEGIDINNGTLVTGSILNTGTIKADSDSIIAYDSHVQGSIINDGTIIAVRNDAIDINQTNIDGSVINNGIIRTGDNAFEIDGSNNNRMVIGGNLENNGDVFAIRGDGVTGSGSDIFDIDDVDIMGNLINTGNSIVDNDGFDISDSSIGGSLLSSGSTTAGDDGYDIDDITIAGDWINSGAITAEDSGFDVEGSRKWHPEQETPDGVTPGYYTLEPVTVGGRFVNSGDITAGDHGIEFDLVSIGINGITEEDGSASFINSGNISAGDGYAMKLEGTTVANDFINSGDLTAELEPDYAAGEYYFNQENTEPSVDGQMVLTPVGTDKNGLTWFSVKNDGVEYKGLRLTEENSGAESDYIYIGAGQEVFVAMESPGDGSENFVLTSVEYGPAPDPVIEVVAESGADLSSSFAAPYNLDNNLARGISLTSRTFDQGSEFEEIVDSAIGGDFINSGNISAVHEGIYINQADIGGLFGNSSDIDSQKATAIDVSANSIGGDFINQGDLTAGRPYEEGDHFRAEWEGEIIPEGGLELEFKGYDENGDAWFVVRNESENYRGLSLQETDGDFSTRGFSVAPGEEVYVNAGQLQGELQLDDGSEALVSAVTDDNEFTAEGRYSHGISLVDVDVAGAFSNSGNIDAYDKGIYLEDVTFGGSLQNTGDVTSGATAIELNDVTAGGGLLNTGDFDAGWEGIFISGNSNLNGGVRNEGDINAFGSGIHITNATLNGDVVNTGDITVSAFDDHGYSTGMELDGVVGVNNFVNHGTITTQDNNWGAGMAAERVFMTGVAGNAGTINSSGLGIALYDVDGATGFVNEGTINAKGSGMYGIMSSIDGNIVNDVDGVINSEYVGIFLGGVQNAKNLVNKGTINATMGDGITAIDTDFEGDVINSGEINAGRNGITLVNLNARSVINTGNITAGTFEPSQPDGEGPFPPGPPGMFEPYGSGIQLVDVNLSGTVGNAGSIDAATHGVVLQDGTAVRGLTNFGTITAGEDAIRVANANVVQADGDGSMMTGHIINETDGVIAADDDGIRIKEAMVQGSVVNKGTVSVGENAIDIDNSYVGGNVLNFGTMTSDETGIDLGSVGFDGMMSIDGSVMNHGTLNAGEGGVFDGIAASRVGIDGMVSNTGDINASGSGIALNDVRVGSGLHNYNNITAGINGIIATDSTVLGDVFNSGTIKADGLDDGLSAGIGLIDVHGISNIVNDGNIVAAGESESATNHAVGIGVQNSSIDGEIVNNGVIIANAYGIAVDDVEGITHVINTKDIGTNARGIYIVNSDLSGNIESFGRINSRNSAIYLEDGEAANLTNSGEIVAREGHGIKVIDSELSGEMLNSGSITAGHHGISLDNATLDGSSLLNFGSITAGKANSEGNGLEAFDSTINGQVANAKGANIDAAAGGIVLDNTGGVTGIINEGTITAGTVGIDVNAESSEFSVGDLINKGTLTVISGPAVRVAGASVGRVVNAGTINGGAVLADVGAPAQASREINTDNAVAFDFRNAGSALNILNGTIVDEEAETVHTGIINGDVYGGGEANDLIIMASGELNGDVYDVENIDITGSITLNNNVFSFNDSSTVTVKDGGTLNMGATDTLHIQGKSNQEAGGDTTVELNVNERGYDEAYITATQDVMFKEGSTITVSIADQDLRNIDVTDGGANFVVATGQGGATNNGDMALGGASNTILLSLTDVSSTSDTKVLGNLAISDLGVLAANGGADTNASNAFAALQGIDSTGLLEMIESNPDLYNSLLNAGKGTDGKVDQAAGESILAAIAEQIVASPENGIAAGQAAQAEAVNTILTRIAELRTGASGISAGDGDDADSNIRPDSLWIRAIYSDGEQDATNSNGSNFNSYALRSKGFTIGADKDVSDTLTLGAGVSVISSIANEKGSSAQRANSETDTYLGSLYAGWRDQDYFTDASVNFGKGGTDLKGADWEANYDSTQLGISIIAGKSFLFDNNDSLIEPRIGFNYTRLETDKYSYTSNGEHITVGSQSLETLELGAGVRFVTGIEVGNGLLLPELSVMAWHDFKGDEVKANVEFETGGGSFTYYGPEAEKTRYQAGVGIEYLMDNNFTLSMNYDHNWQDGFKADTWVAKLRYDF